MKFHLIVFTLFLPLMSGLYAQAEDDINLAVELDKMLKNLFSKQHDVLIPKVAVADIFFACNADNNNDFGTKALADLIQNVSKEKLAENLSACLNGQSVKSDKAINYGLLGCFHDQLDELPEEEQRHKIKLVKQAIASLSIEEKKKSLSQCVTDQAISYLK